MTVAGGDALEADVLLVAVGRGPATRGLGYEEQGIAMDRGFVITDERLRTNVPHVYAVGDIVPGLQLAHRGFQQGIFVAEEIAGRSPEPVDEAAIPRVTYCEPEVASVRYSEQGAGLQQWPPPRRVGIANACAPDPERGPGRGVHGARGQAIARPRVRRSRGQRPASVRSAHPGRRGRSVDEVIEERPGYVGVDPVGEVRRGHRASRSRGSRPGGCPSRRRGRAGR